MNVWTSAWEWMMNQLRVYISGLSGRPTWVMMWCVLQAAWSRKLSWWGLQLTWRSLIFAGLHYYGCLLPCWSLWRDKTEGHKRSRSFLEYIDDNMTQVIKELTRADALLDFTKKYKNCSYDAWGWGSWLMSLQGHSQLTLKLLFSRRSKLRFWRTIDWSPSIPSKAMDQIIPETISKHAKDKKVIGRSQHGFMKRKLCLTKCIALYDETTGLVNNGRAADVIYLNFGMILLQRPIESS